MKSADVMRLCAAEMRKRFPGCDAECNIVKVAEDKIAPRAAWLSGCNRSGWVAEINCHSPRRVFARFEAHGITPGVAAATLAKAIGVELPQGATTKEVSR